MYIDFWSSFKTTTSAVWKYRIRPSVYNYVDPQSAPSTTFGFEERIHKIGNDIKKREKLGLNINKIE